MILLRTMHRPVARGRRTGYSLLELLLVLALILIIATLLVPSLQSTIVRFRVDQAADRWAAAIRTTRLRAMETQTPHGVTFIPGTDQYQVWAARDDSAQAAEANSELFRLAASDRSGGLTFFDCRRDDRSQLLLAQQGKRGVGDSRDRDGVSIIFAPDGSANQDHCVQIRDIQSNRIAEIRIQALTGSISGVSSP